MPRFNQEELKKQKIARLGQENFNNQGYLMKVIEYIDSKNVVVEFQDKYKGRVSCYWKSFVDGEVKNPYMRLGEEQYNNQRCLMKIVVYNNNDDIVVEFQDEYKGKVHTSYQRFLSGDVRNPYYPNVYGLGITGNKYPLNANGKPTKEYYTWSNMMRRCYSREFKEKEPTYQEVICCNEWLLYENFYEWLHSQENFEKWLNGNKWAIDKDIIYKNNKIYSPETCCLVTKSINSLFTKRDNDRGDLPIGVSKCGEKFKSVCMNPITNNHDYLGLYPTPFKAFYAYKLHKEEIIKQIAQEEYDNGNITERCYQAMMNYEVEITD